MNHSVIDYSTYNSLIKQLQILLSEKSALVLAIDGMCGSGKTTLAEYLTTIFDATVIHMDNFFLPFERKTPKRLAEAGGNIDYERFLQVALPSLMERTPFSYTAYNCRTAAFDRHIEVPACQLIIVEGSYSLHEKFGNYYDYALFLEISLEEQLQRLEARCNDSKKFQRFKTEWIPMEQHYHNVQHVISRCNCRIDTSTKP